MHNLTLTLVSQLCVLLAAPQSGPTICIAQPRPLARMLSHVARAALPTKAAQNTSTLDASGFNKNFQRERIRLMKPSRLFHTLGRAGTLFFAVSVFSISMAPRPFATPPPSAAVWSDAELFVLATKTGGQIDGPGVNTHISPVGFAGANDRLDSVRSKESTL